jgi:hypothetical protein
MAIAKKTLVFAAAAVAALLLLAAAAPAAASPVLGPRRNLKNNNNNNNQNQNNNNNNPLEPPVVTCVNSTNTTIQVEVCPGDKAPFGFQLQYEEIEAFIASGGFPCNGEGDDGLCTATVTEAFVNTDDCWILTIGVGPVAGVTFDPASCSGPLSCGVDVILRATALGGSGFNASTPSATTVCSTTPCPPPATCTNAEGTICGVCIKASSGGCGTNNLDLVCSLYGVPIADCQISAVGGGGGGNSECTPGFVCCAVFEPETIPPVGGVCPIVTDSGVPGVTASAFLGATAFETATAFVPYPLKK